MYREPTQCFNFLSTLTKYKISQLHKGIKKDNSAKKKIKFLFIVNCAEVSMPSIKCSLLSMKEVKFEMKIIPNRNCHTRFLSVSLHLIRGFFSKVCSLISSFLWKTIKTMLEEV